LFGVRLPETVHLWRDYSMQGTGLDDLEENFTSKHHTAVSIDKTSLRVSHRVINLLI